MIEMGGELRQNATIWDLLLALVAGFAGGLGNSRDQEPQSRFPRQK